MKYIVLILAMLATSVAFSQIVNVESKRPGSTDQGWHGNFDLNVDYTKNTSQVLKFGTKNSIQYLKNEHRVLLLTDMQRTKAGGTNFINNGYEHLRYNYDLGKKGHFSVEAFQQAQFNSVLKIQLRHLTGAGIRLNFWDNDSLKFWMGTLPMFEYEILTTNIVSKNIRESSYLLFYKQFKNGVEFQTIGYYQPRIDWLGDYRLSNNTTLEFGLLSWLRFRVGFDMLFDSNPPADIPQLIFSVKNGLMAEF